MIGHKYVPSREGGVEIVVDELSTRMVAQGHEVTIFNRKRKEYPHIDSYKGCKVEEIYTINKKSLDAIVYAYFATRRAKKLIKKGLVDVVHFHAEGPCYFLYRLPKPGKRNGCKVVVTIHGLDWQRGKWGGFASKILKKGEQNAVKYADEIIVLSKNNQKYFKETYNRETTYIPNGIQKPIPHEPEIIKEKWGLDKNSYILFLARIVPEKGLDYLIDAWKQIEGTTDKKLVFAGGSSHSDEYFNSVMAKIKDDETIVTTGFVQGQTLQELYSNAFLYVLPSDIEGMPMSLLEAMSYGNKCLVSNIPENTEVINEDCLVFEKSNVESLKEQLIAALKTDLNENRKSVVTNTWDEVVDKTLELYTR